MMLTLEKVLFLKSVDLFAKVPETDLVEVAAIAKEAEYRSGEPVVREGDLGDSMFIVVDGRVRVHKKDRELEQIGPRQVFGELLALDPAPRSATVTAMDDTLVFSLAGDLLYDLMAEHMDVTRGIIRVLCQRIRASN